MCRVVSLDIIQKERMKQGTLNYYDKDKYREMILDAAEHLWQRMFGQLLLQHKKENNLIQHILYFFLL